MANKLISIRISDTLLKDAITIGREGGFSNVQEFVRDSIRNNIQKHKLKNQINELRKLYGSAKNPKLKTKEEIDEYVRKFYFS